MLKALSWLLVFQLAGEAIVKALKLPLPGPVIGMLLLFAALVWRGGVADDLRDAGSALLQHLMLLFVPAVTGVVLHVRRVGEEWLPILAACIAGSAITLAITALVLQWLLRRRAAGHDAKERP